MSEKIFCNRCKQKTNHDILKSEKIVIHDDDVQVSFFEKYEIIKCLGCDEVSFRQLSSNSETRDIENGELIESVEYFPVRNKDKKALIGFYNTPLIVRKIYIETIRAYNNELYILCAAGLRAIIESICIAENIKNGPVKKTLPDGKEITERKRDLNGKINGLREKGILTSKQTEILHEHRFLGNDAIHEITTSNKLVLLTAIEIVEEVLTLLYEIDEKADLLSSRRKHREESKKKNSNC